MHENIWIDRYGKIAAGAVRFLHNRKMRPLLVTEADYANLSLLESPPLRRWLASATRVWSDAMPANVVTMNSRVHCREEGSGKDYHLTLVYPHDAGKEGTVSVLAPVGTALLGMSVGQHIDWPTPGGKVLQLTLLAVEYQPEAAGDPF